MLKQLVEDNIQNLNKLKSENSAATLNYETSLRIFTAINGIDYDEAIKKKEQKVDLTPSGLMRYHNFTIPNFYKT